jgi:hypothetical protein
MESPAAFADDSCEEPQEFAAVIVVAIDLATLVAAAGDVPAGTRKFKT